MKTNFKIKYLFIIIFIILTFAIFSQNSDSTNDSELGSIDDLLNQFNTNDSTTDTNNNSSSINEIGIMLSLLGEHSFIYRFPVINDHSDYYGNIKAPRFNNDLGVELNYKFVELKAHWEIDGIVRESGNIEDILKVKPLENSLVLKPWKFIIGVGYLYHTWGTGDEINPTDNLNSFDYTGTKKEKNSVLSMYVEFFPVKFLSIEAVYIPFLAKDVNPLNFIDELKDEIEIDDIKEELPDYDPSTFSLGGKINFYFQYADFSFSYLYDIDPYYTPVIELSSIKAYGKTYFYTIDSIELRKNRIHYFGADIKTTVGPFGIWAEVCYAMSEDYKMDLYHIKNHKLSWVLGFDFNFGPNQDFYFNFQYFGDFSPYFDDKLDEDYDDADFGNKELPFELEQDEEYYEEYYYRSLVNYLGGITEGLNQGFSFKLQFPFNINHFSFEPSIAAAYMFPLLYDYKKKMRYGNLYVNPEFIFSPIDSVDLIIGADLFFAWEQEEDEAHVQIAQKDKFGVYHYDSSIYLEVKFKWGFDFKK